MPAKARRGISSPEAELQFLVILLDECWDSDCISSARVVCVLNH